MEVRTLASLAMDPFVPAVKCFH